MKETLGFTPACNQPQCKRVPDLLIDIDANQSTLIGFMYGVFVDRFQLAEVLLLCLCC